MSGAHPGSVDWDDEPEWFADLFDGPADEFGYGEKQRTLGFSTLWMKLVRHPLMPLSKMHTLVAYVLEDYMDQDGKCWPSYSAIMRAGKISRPTVASALTALEELGLLEIGTIPPKRNGEWPRNVYQAVIPERCPLPSVNGANATGKRDTPSVNGANRSVNGANRSGSRDEHEGSTGLPAGSHSRLPSKAAPPTGGGAPPSADVPNGVLRRIEHYLLKGHGQDVAEEMARKDFEANRLPEVAV